jgi:3-hydroxybutyryl-CoA dehydrogenase
MSEAFLLGVLGPGTLGLSVAQWAAECGLQVRLLGRDRSHALRGREEMARRWATLAAKGKLSEAQRETLLAQVSAGEQGEVEGLDALLEAGPEDPGLKAELWRELAPRLEEGTLALTGSSALPVGALRKAAGLGHLLGFHLFVPVRSMPVVELVVPQGAEGAWIRRGEDLAERLRKRVVKVRDVPGYAAARMALAQGVEAMRLLEEGVADAVGLDALMVGGYGHPIGPLALTDQVGLDLRLAILRQVFDATGDPRFRPPAILESLVAKGRLGRATGRGFHVWNEEEDP